MLEEIFLSSQLHTTLLLARILQTNLFPFNSPFRRSVASPWLIAFPASVTLTLVGPDQEAQHHNSDLFPGDEPTGTASGQGSFLDRERAALGEDADQFATEQDRTTTSATVQDDDNDLLGGDDDFGEPQHPAATTQDDLDFESSYPAIDTQNEVG